MPDTKYTYSISQDFPNHVVATDRLTQEIDESEIKVALDYINTFEDACDIWFKEDLDVTDESVLTTVVSNHSGEPLPEPIENVNIAAADSSVHLHSQLVGFQDLSGHNVYRFGSLEYDIEAGETNVFMEKFDSVMYLSGGGVSIPEYLWVNGEKVDQKVEKGDYNRFDLVDVDNVLGYGMTAQISKVSRSANVATITTAAPHTFQPGYPVCINVSDDTFDDLETVVATAPTSTTLTYTNVGDDVAEKDATGDVGLIVVLVPFVPDDYNCPGKEWECKCGDAKAVPPGVFMRFTCYSVGTHNYTLYVHYNLRT